MTKSRRLLVAGLVTLCLAGTAAAGLWWWQQGRQLAPADAAPKPSTWRYVTLDKIIVMLRNQAGEPLAHYMAVDLVFRTEALKEKDLKDQLPLLRSVAVQALSEYTLVRASALSIDQLAGEINAAYSARYAADGVEQPFAEAMIGKLIIE